MFDAACAVGAVDFVAGTETFVAGTGRTVLAGKALVTGVRWPERFWFERGGMHTYVEFPHLNVSALQHCISCPMHVALLCFGPHKPSFAR